MYVVDASVYASVAVKDEFYTRSKAFLAKSRSLGCVTLDLALVEAFNVLWKHVYLLKRIPAGRCLEISAILERIFENSVVGVYSAIRECKSAVEISVKYGITVYDAVYVSLADRLGYKLASFDEELESRLAGTGLENIVYILR
ncbi:MAG: type II toxin-antitoxin system VapC family toxin [Thermoproteales archaeon]|nr:type II toxin-antitoxin system VapC family toxin [Thermoproteales archaeon]